MYIVQLRFQLIIRISKYDTSVAFDNKSILMLFKYRLIVEPIRSNSLNNNFEHKPDTFLGKNPLKISLNVRQKDIKKKQKQWD